MQLATAPAARLDRKARALDNVTRTWRRLANVAQTGTLAQLEQLLAVAAEWQQTALAEGADIDDIDAAKMKAA